MATNVFTVDGARAAIEAAVAPVRASASLAQSQAASASTALASVSDAVETATRAAADASAAVAAVADVPARVDAVEATVAAVSDLPAKVEAVEATVAAVAEVPAKVEAVESTVTTLGSTVEAVKTFPTLASLLAFSPASALPSVVRTVGHTFESDQGGMEWSIVTWSPQAGHVWSKIGIKLDDGRWLIPRSLRTAATTPATSAAVMTDVERRARSFVTDKLIWDASRVSPLHDSYVRGTGREPVTCSQFAGMVLSGYDYEHTKYVADANTVVGARVVFDAFTSENPWQAHRMARWAFTNGDFWALLSQDGIADGDVLFFAEQNPEGAGNTYFGNIYHVGIYLGGGLIIQSKSASDPTGVVVEQLASMSDSPAFAWRPNWIANQATGVNTSGFLTLNYDDPVPDGTVDGTIIFRTEA